VFADRENHRDGGLAVRRLGAVCGCARFSADRRCLSWVCRQHDTGQVMLLSQRSSSCRLGPLEWNEIISIFGANRPAELKPFNIDPILWERAWVGS